MKNEPKQIYLNVGQIEGYDQVDFKKCEAVTWSEHQIYENDIKYIKPYEWSPCSYGEAIDNGDYFFLTKNGEISDTAFIRVSEGRVPYYFAVSYIKITLPDIHDNPTTP